ncbi:MAG: type II toxin-antitoxin system Phd/YefM family antitoxin [Pseudohaliea sp.]
MKTVDIGQAMAKLFDLVDKVANGDSFLITRDGEPVARVTPIADARSGETRRLGFLAGEFNVPDDFDRMRPRCGRYW